MGRRIGLALGSGGARGYAHIGVINELQSRGYDIVAVSGTSMGAVIGGLHAAGHLDEFVDWVSTLSSRDVLRLMDPTLRAPGVIKAEKVMSRVRSILRGARIEDLPIPYTAVAADLRNQREVWFQRGPMHAAMRASIALPSFVTPVTINGVLLVDGGVLNPVPVAPLMGVQCDAIIAVSVSGKRRNHTSRGPAYESSEEADKDSFEMKTPTDVKTINLIDLSIAAMQNLITRHRLAGYPPDVLIEIPGDAAGTLEFHRVAEMTELGRDAAKIALDKYEA